MYGLLLYFNKPARFIQTATAMLGISIILSGFFLIAVMLLQITGFSFVVFFIILYWNFMAITNIFTMSFEIGIIKAGFLSLIYMLLQYNVNDIIFQYLAK